MPQIRKKHPWIRGKTSKPVLPFPILITSSEEADMAACSKRRVAEEDQGKDDLKKSRVEGSKVEKAAGEAAEDGGVPQASKCEEVSTEAEKEREDNAGLKDFTLGKK